MNKDSRNIGRIIVAEDGPAALRKIASQLEQRDPTRRSASPAARRTPIEPLPVVIIVDAVPDGHTADVPIVVVTTPGRREAAARAVQLASGSGSEAAMPTDLPDFIMRLRAALHRHESVPMTRLQRQRCPGYRFNSWRLDCRRRRLSDPDGNAVPLTNGEFALLCAFLEAPRRVLSRVHLLQATRLHEDIFDRSIDVQVMRLRRKLQKCPTDRRVIRTERGIGYVFDAIVDSD